MVFENFVGGGIFLGRFILMFNKGILSWSLMPGMLCVLSMREGFVVRKSSRMVLHPAAQNSRILIF